VVSLLGALAALAGILLTVTPSTISVSRRGNTVTVGESILTAVSADPDVFRGDAVLVVHRRPDGTVRAAASTQAAGRLSTGACTMTRRSDRLVEETCEFRLGARRLTAVDHLDVGSGAAWRRRYDDGREVTITVHPDAAVVPVPFPIGR